MRDGRSSGQQEAHAQRIAATLKQTQKTVEMSQADRPTWRREKVRVLRQ